MFWSNWTNFLHEITLFHLSFSFKWFRNNWMTKTNEKLINNKNIKNWQVIEFCMKIFQYKKKEPFSCENQRHQCEIYIRAFKIFHCFFPFFFYPFKCIEYNCFDRFLYFVMMMCISVQSSDIIYYFINIIELKSFSMRFFFCFFFLWSNSFIHISLYIHILNWCHLNRLAIIV